jgi:RNA polymerase sigma-70 factor, ECF subfamily
MRDSGSGIRDSRLRRPVNPWAAAGVWLDGTRMNELAPGYAGLVTGEDHGLSGADAVLEREFGERLRESSSLAFRVAYGVLRHREDAEDVAQEAFVRAHGRIGQLRDRERFRAWLVRMCWRLAIDRIRSEKRRTAREQAVAQSAEVTTEDTASARERAERLWAAIDELPEKLRIAIVLSGIEGHDVAAVGRLLEIPEGTVKSRLFLARKQLAKKLQCLANTTSTGS